jgi:hypothetical protein
MGDLPVSDTPPKGKTNPASLVLYCLLRKRSEEEQDVRFCLIRKQGHMTFPPTKFRPGEDLSTPMRRPQGREFGTLHLFEAGGR